MMTLVSILKGQTVGHVPGLVVTVIFTRFLLYGTFSMKHTERLLRDYHEKLLATNLVTSLLQKLLLLS